MLLECLDSWFWLHCLRLESQSVTSRISLFSMSFWSKSFQSKKNNFGLIKPPASSRFKSRAGQIRHSVANGQYLNCKILNGGTLLQPWPNAFGMRKYFSEDYVIPSSKVMKPKKRLSPKIQEFLYRNYVQIKKKIFAVNWSVTPSKSVFLRNLVLYSAGICRSFLSDYASPNYQWGDANSWSGDASPRVLPTIWVLPTARHRCDISSKGAVLPRRNDAEMGPDNSLHALALCSKYNKKFDLI